MRLHTSAEGLAAFQKMCLDACILLRPPEKLDIAEWADKYGMLSAEGSATPGKWYTSNAEYQRTPMQVLSPGTLFQTIVLMWASQVGKTQIALFLAAYHMQHDPAPQLFVEPSEDLCKVISKDRIDPMIRDTPVLARIFAGRRGKKDTMHKPYPGGQLTFGWASSPTQLASRPIRIAVSDEEGRYDLAANKEGDPVDLLRKRMATFKSSRKHLRVSSPALRRTCRITKAYKESDQRRYYVPCPQCEHMQTLRWEQIQWPKTEDGSAIADDAYYVCEANGCEITESDKFGMISRGEWRAENPGGGDGRTAGFHLNALYSTIGYTWAEIVAEYIKCEGIQDKLQAFTNTVLAEPWDEQAEGADLNAVARHAEDYAAQAPAWVVMVTCGTDVQKDRIEATKWGFGLHSQSGVIEHRIFYGKTNIAGQGAWADYDAWRRLRVDHESGLQLPVACTFVDSGDGNRTEAVYAYCRSRESEKVFATKGSSTTAAPVVSNAKRVGKTKALLVVTGSSTVKDVLYSRFAIEDKAAPGYIHFPKHADAGCTPEFFAQITSEALVTHQTKGGEIARWEPQRARNEALDCAVYAFAAKEFTRAPMKELARRLAARAALLDPSAKQQLALSWAERVTAPSPASPLPVSSPASPLSRHNGAKKKKKRIFRPGSGWIRGH